MCVSIKTATKEKHHYTTSYLKNPYYDISVDIFSLLLYYSKVLIRSKEVNYGLYTKNQRCEKKTFLMSYEVVSFNLFVFFVKKKTTTGILAIRWINRNSSFFFFLTFPAQHSYVVLMYSSKVFSLYQWLSITHWPL